MCSSHTSVVALVLNRNLEVRGTPPDLLVTLALGNMSDHDSGTWRLRLSNDMGGDDINFTLNVISGE